MAKKFNKKAFKLWLDNLCKIVVKTRDGYQCRKCKKLIIDIYNCQWCHVRSRKSNILRWDLFNTFTLCGTCHAFAHDNPNEGWSWISDGIHDYLQEKMNQPTTTWREVDFLKVEYALLEKAIDLDVDPMNMPLVHRKRLINKLHEINS